MRNNVMAFMWFGCAIVWGFIHLDTVWTGYDFLVGILLNVLGFYRLYLFVKENES